MTTRNHAARFCQNNQAAASGATISVSSAAAGFPGSNAVDQRRYKRWVTTGAFRVISSNKKIYINDGSDKTVTLTEATYTTGALLASHIQTQLNASSTNWTVTYSSSTYKFTIGRSSGTAILKLTSTTDAGWDTLGFVGVSDQNVGTGTSGDEQRNHTSERFRVDLGTAKEILAFFVISAADEEFPVSSAGTMTLKGDNVSSNLDPGGSPTVSVTLSRETTGIFKFIDDLASTTLRYWEFEFEDRLNPNGPAFQIHNIYLGDYVSPVSRTVTNGFVKRLIDPSTSQRSLAGAEFNSLRTRYTVFDSVGFQELDGTDRTEIQRIGLELGTSIPFFFSLDPLGLISSSVGENTKYVKFNSDIEMTHFKYDRFFVSMSLREVVA